MRRIMIFRGSSFAPCLRNRQNQRSKNIFDVARNRFSSSSTVSGRSYVESAIRQNWKDRQDLAACYRLLNGIFRRSIKFFEKKNTKLGLLCIKKLPDNKTVYFFNSSKF